MKFRSLWSTNAILTISFFLTLIAAMPVWVGGQEESSDAQFYLKPTAFAGPDQVAVIGTLVEFFGQGTSADDEIVEYAWDFESDGVQDFVSTQTGHTVH